MRYSLDKGFIFDWKLFPAESETQAETLGLLAWYRVISRLVIRKRISISHAFEFLVDLLDLVPWTENMRCCCVDNGGVSRGGKNGRITECYDVIHGDLVIGFLSLTG